MLVKVLCGITAFVWIKYSCCVFRDPCVLIRLQIIPTTKNIRTCYSCVLFADPTNVGCDFIAFSLLPSVNPTYIKISTNRNKQDVLKQPEANTDLLYFSTLSYYKSSAETNFPIFATVFLHILITCYVTSRQEIISQNHACMPAKSHKSQCCEANVINISNEIFAPFQFVPVRMKTRKYHH